MVQLSLTKVVEIKQAVETWALLKSDGIQKLIAIIQASTDVNEKQDAIAILGSWGAKEALETIESVRRNNNEDPDTKELAEAARAYIPY